MGFNSPWCGHGPSKYQKNGEFYVSLEFESVRTKFWFASRYYLDDLVCQIKSLNYFNFVRYKPAKSENWPK